MFKHKIKSKNRFKIYQFVFIYNNRKMSKNSPIKKDESLAHINNDDDV